MIKFDYYFLKFLLIVNNIYNYQEFRKPDSYRVLSHASKKHGFYEFNGMSSGTE